ncbi:MAG TPA: hypothetical protein PKV33_11440 [Methanothrix sp.]|nr:hypothetical protein [Methanothrix sp.]
MFKKLRLPAGKAAGKWVSAGMASKFEICHDTKKKEQKAGKMP